MIAENGSTSYARQKVFAITCFNLKLFAKTCPVILFELLFSNDNKLFFPGNNLTCARALTEKKN